MGIGAALCTVYGVFPGLLYQFLPFAFEYHPFTVDHVVQYVQLLVASIIPFTMYLKNMEPHSKLSLDTDWLYRKPLAVIVSGISCVCVAIQVSLGNFFKGIYDGARKDMKNPMRLIGQRPRDMEHAGDHIEDPDEFDPDAYRPRISEAIVITMTVLLMAVLFIAM